MVRRHGVKELQVKGNDGNVAAVGHNVAAVVLTAVQCAQGRVGGAGIDQFDALVEQARAAAHIGGAECRSGAVSDAQVEPGAGGRHLEPGGQVVLDAHIERAIRRTTGVFHHDCERNQVGAVDAGYIAVECSTQVAGGH